MKSLRMYSLFSLVFSIGMALQACHPTSPAPSASPSSAPTAQGDEEPIILGHSYRLQSDVLNMEMRISVRLPQGWMGYEDGEKRNYPVLYVVDGGPDQDFPHLAGLMQSREINDTFSPVILVGIETVNRRYQITPPVTDVAAYVSEIGVEPGGSADFRRFIEDELKPWVNHKYRTSGRDAIMGESLGGLFVIETLMEAPEMFDDFIAVNPSLWWEGMTYGTEAATRLSSNLRDKRLYLTSSEEGFLMEDGIEALVDTLERRPTPDLSWVYFALAGEETHASAYHGAAMNAVRTLFPQTVQFGQGQSLITGQPNAPRTTEHEALIAKPCSLDTAKRVPLTETYKAPDRYAYQCLLQAYGPKPTAGNMSLPYHP